MWQKARMTLTRFLWREKGFKFLFACFIFVVGFSLLIFPGEGMFNRFLAILFYFFAFLLLHFASPRFTKELPEYKIEEAEKIWKEKVTNKNYPELLARFDEIIIATKKNLDTSMLEKWFEDYYKMLRFQRDVKGLEAAIPAIQKEIEDLPDKLRLLCKRRGEIPHEIAQAKQAVEKMKKKLLS